MNLTTENSAIRVQVIVLLFLCFVASVTAFGQFPPPPGGGVLPVPGFDAPGKNDLSYNMFDPGFGRDEGFNSNVNDLLIQSNGSILAAGVFTSYNGKKTLGLVRFRADGSLDEAFRSNSVAAFPSNVFSINDFVVQPDGKIIAVGFMPERVVRFNADGTKDDSFVVGSGLNSTVTTVALQTDGKIIVGGTFSSYAGTPRRSIARLNADGTLDQSFDPGDGFARSVGTPTVNALLLQPSGNIIVGGSFDTYNGVARQHLVRLSTTGALDQQFLTGQVVDRQVRSLATHPSGDILVGGDFVILGRHLLKLNAADGSIDPAFQNNVRLAGLSAIISIHVTDNDQLLLTGFFRERVKKLNADGTVANEFDVGNAFGSFIVNDAVQRLTGEVIAGGSFEEVAGESRQKISQLEADGTLSQGIFEVSGFFIGNNAQVYAAAIQPDGQIVVGGFFNAYDDLITGNILRLRQNGELDRDFSLQGDFTNVVIHISLQSDGKILTAGNHGSFNSTRTGVVARLNQDGSVDEDFAANFFSQFTGGSARRVFQAPNGKIFAIGGFSSPSGGFFQAVLSLNEDGTLNTSFANDGIALITGSGSELLLQPDGKLIVLGTFSAIGGASARNIARLHPDGTLDDTFVTGTGFNSNVVSGLLMPNGEVIVAGFFSQYNGSSTSRLASIKPDGSLNETFEQNIRSNRPNNPRVLALSGTTRILVAEGNGTLTRLNNDGTLDETFDSGDGFNGPVEVIARQAESKVLIGGGFTAYDGTGRSRMARIFDGSTPQVVRSESRLSGFVASPNAPSTPQTLEISGNELREDVRFTDMTGRFEFSKDGSEYNSTLLFPIENGNIIGEPVEVSVRLKAGLDPGTYFTLAIFQSEGILPAVLTLNGEVRCPDISFEFEANEETCPGASDASLQLTNASGGVAPYSYSIDGGATFQSESNFTDLAAGTYSLIVRDDQGCVSPATSVELQQATDSTDPIIECPDRQFLAANSDCGAPLPDLSSLVTVSDDCSAVENLVITQRPQVGFFLDEAIHIITVTVTDESGNEASCEIEIEIIDRSAPVLNCPAEVELIADANCQAVLPDFSTQIDVKDNCAEEQDIRIRQSPSAGTTLTPGVTMVEITARDIEGNESTCTIAVSVLDDQAPMIECPAMVEIVADEDCNGVVPDLSDRVIASDNCSPIEDLVIAQSPAAGEVAQDGQLVTITVSDEAGNQSSCSTTLSVIDNSAPTVLCPNPLQLIADGDCQAPIPNLLPRVLTFDNCARGSEISLSQVPAAGTVVAAGVHNIEIKAVDPSGNESSCSVSITVIDIAPPTVTCLDEYEIEVNKSCLGIVPDFSSLLNPIDQCNTFEELSFEQDPPAGEELAVGEYLVFFLATDATGNTAECTFPLSVVDDEAPTLVVGGIEVSLDENGEATIAPEDIDQGTVDVCGLSSLRIDRSQFTCDDLGVQRVTFEAEDVNGNTSTESVEVIIKDDLPPAISTLADITLSVDESGTGRVVVFEVPNASDNCDSNPTVRLEAGLPPGSVFPAGTTTVEYSAEDQSGNRSSTTFDVTITDGLAVLSFDLVKAGSGEIVRELANGSFVDVADPETASFSIFANPNRQPGSIIFSLDGVDIQTENFAAYAVAGNGRQVNPFEPGIGIHTLTATPFTEKRGQGSRGIPLTVTFEVVNLSSVAVFQLINAETNQPIRPIIDQDEIDVAGNPELTVEAITDPEIVGSVLFEFNDEKPRVENLIPYSLSSGGGDQFRATDFQAGSQVLTATPYEKKKAKGSSGTPLTVSFNVINSETVTSFELVEAPSGVVIGPLMDGATIDLSDPRFRQFSIAASTNKDEVGSVVFNLDGKDIQTENFVPYAAAGDKSGRFNRLKLSNGPHTLTATPFSSQKGKGVAGTPLSVSFVVQSSALSRERPEAPAVTAPTVLSLEGTVYPNPVADHLNISISSPYGEKAELMIVDLQGREIFEDQVELLEGINVFELDISRVPLTQGSFLLKLNTSSQGAITFHLLKGE